jgi:hypothetical protein
MISEVKKFDNKDGYVATIKKWEIPAKPLEVTKEIVENNQHYALNCIIPLFNILAPTCFGISLPSSGSFLDPSELHEIQIE